MKELTLTIMSGMNAEELRRLSVLSEPVRRRLGAVRLVKSFRVTIAIGA